MDWIIEKYHLCDIKKRFTSHKRICELIIVLFLMFIYLLLKNSNIPKIEYQFTKSYRQIDWQRHVPERIKLVKKHEIPVPSTQDIIENRPSLDWEEILDTDFLNNDVSTILNQLTDRTSLDIQEKQSDNEFYKFPVAITDHSILIEQRKDYLKDNATNLVPHLQVKSKNIGPSIMINDTAINQSKIGKKQIYPNREQALINVDKIIPESGVIEIPLINPQKVSNKTDISEIIDQLMSWMKKHPSEFNHVVKSFMMFEQDDMTSKVVFRHKNRVFELYLLYKEKIKEIRICLIEENQSTMLIDSGFKKQSNYLRTGNVARLKDGAIFSFGTSQYPASEKAASEFYQFFLSWWEQANRES